MREQGGAIIGILGIGNLLLRDEGFGVHVIRYLESRFHFPPRVRLLDGGTAGLYLAPFLEETDHVLVIDVVAMDEEPGSIHAFTEGDLKAGVIQARMSPHQLGILEILEICKLRGKAPATVDFFGVVPSDLSTGMELSSTLEARVPQVAALVIEHLKSLGVTAEQKREQEHA